ncbi:alpha-ketoglutarate-dependent dioxygenase alkB homolog 3 isoform X2 [Melanotaenia boesemani]|uniref:alpha-ketoglutarate-dependent dioxygenase alkB homolog 3 isoform X2 n=1 Tax=Melanotaenia boesemani TaxID=1250792 RepID=UPI001C051C86|nr:alpha-ketoglutarate-dependent dioxygenase alkB homolog 3 isoform X2 [Melanotaenia boesemani]XP_041854025.1 alpha-ketoglutarate-dependent dioxygenase alkB homolog 3 isoform X2 [Melanotaenia boesemani]
MSDKRQRARVQGSWAKQMPKQSNPTGRSMVPNNNQSKDANTVSGSWGFGNQKTSKSFEFHQPTKQARDVPPEKAIEKMGDYEISHGPSGVSQLRLRPGFIPQEEADWMFSKLLAELPWSQKTNYRQGEEYEEPRLTCWYGELPYTYARSTMPAKAEWHPLLVTLRKAVEQMSGCSFNSLLCNLYRDGHDSIGWHSDDEASLGDKPSIASLSLGDTRIFSLRKQPLPEDNGDYTYVERIRVPLSHGTLLLMEGATQDDWQHQVAKEYHDRGPRINLTFRTIHPEPQGYRPGTKMRFTTKQP